MKRRTAWRYLSLVNDAFRYIGYWVGMEVRTNKRGWAIISWFLFIFIYDIKMYFVLQHVWTSCALFTVEIDSKTLLAKGSKFLISNLARNKSENNLGSFYSSMVEQPPSCEYSLVEKKVLIILQAILLPALYLALVGAEHIRNLTNFRHLEEVKMRMFWVVVDILDILQLQSSMWEANTHRMPHTSPAGIYFYCYVLLVVLPAISMSEMSKHEHEFAPHKMIFYLIASVLFVNIGSSIIRILLLFYFNFNLVSSIFLAKNTLCLGMQVSQLK